MFFIPGSVIGALTFPGIIVHETAHMFFCKMYKVPVFDVRFFGLDERGAYVIHGKTDSFLSTFMISMGPFFVNTLLCLLICLPAYMPFSFFDLKQPLSYFLMWFGVSIGMHAIPSNQDASNVWNQALVEIKKLNPLAVISFPLMALIYLFNLLRFFWADLIYGVAIGIGIPSLIWS